MLGTNTAIKSISNNPKHKKQLKLASISIISYLVQRTEIYNLVSTSHCFIVIYVSFFVRIEMKGTAQTVCSLGQMA